MNESPPSPRIIVRLDRYADLGGREIEHRSLYQGEALPPSLPAFEGIAIIKTSMGPGELRFAIGAASISEAFDLFDAARDKAISEARQKMLAPSPADISRFLHGGG